MGFLFKKSRPSPSQAVPSITGLQVQTAVNVLPIPIIYGSPRVGLNLIWYNDFKAVQTTTGGGSRGGKGLLGGGVSGKGGGGGVAGPVQTTTTYYANIILAIGEGPIGNPIGHPIWLYKNQDVYNYFDNTAGISLFYGGDAAQTPDPTIAALHPEQSLAYRHTSYLLALNYQLDSSGTVPQHNIVVQGILGGTSWLNLDAIGGYEDADPALVVNDIMTNPYYGVGFPGALIDPNIFSGSNAPVVGVGDTAYQSYCQAIGFGLSFAISDFEPASSILDRILTATNSVAVWNGVHFTIVPRTIGYVDNNPGFVQLDGITKRYFNNPIVLAATFYDANILETTDNTDPITIARKDPYSAYNVVRVTFQERGNAYNSDIAEFSVDSEVDQYGRREEDLGGTLFTSSVPAHIAAQLRAQNNVAIRNTYTFKTSWEYAYLDPMDFILVVDSVVEPGGMICWIQSIEEDEQGMITIVAEQV